MKEDRLAKLVGELAKWLKENDLSKFEAIALLEATKQTISYQALNKYSKDLPNNLKGGMYG